MNVTELIEETRTLRQYLAEARPELSFTYELHEPDEPFGRYCAQWRDHLPERVSGVYVFHWPRNCTIYIGKAAQDNMGAEVWNKMKNFKIVDDDDVEFYQTPFLVASAYPNVDSDVREAVRKGEIFVSVIAISPGCLSSLVEVYLQTAHHRLAERLPAFNRRIG